MSFYWVVTSDFHFKSVKTQHGMLTALGVTNDENTDSKMTIKKMIIAQVLGGAIYSFFGGQHLVILVTTAPVVIFTYIIKSISDDLDQDFYAMYWSVA